MYPRPSWWEKWATYRSWHRDNRTTEAAELERTNHRKRVELVPYGTSTPNKNRRCRRTRVRPGTVLEGTVLQLRSHDGYRHCKSTARSRYCGNKLGTAHGLNSNHPPMLDGRVFFRSGSYPQAPPSLLRYELEKGRSGVMGDKSWKRESGGTHRHARDWRVFLQPSCCRGEAERNGSSIGSPKMRTRMIPGCGSKRKGGGLSCRISPSDESDEYVPAFWILKWRFTLPKGRW
jgi:hypothetical protein